MEGLHWFLMVFPGSTAQGQINHQISSGDHGDFDDNADWSEHWSERSSDNWTSSPANKLACLENQCNGYSVHCVSFIILYRLA